MNRVLTKKCFAAFYRFGVWELRGQCLRSWECSLFGLGEVVVTIGNSRVSIVRVHVLE